ncbi:transposase protein [Holotrichia oblita]|uniref:Transposase protein n=1 Tax=Holotrichia oblita TaxID=644536 RepID=A0ACB9TMK5_HOLOL|nr:transposase protein [Holotrichia oblita]
MLEVDLQSNNHPIFPYNSSDTLKVMGKFKGNFKVNKAQTQADVVVVEGDEIVLIPVPGPSNEVESDYVFHKDAPTISKRTTDKRNADHASNYSPILAKVPKIEVPQKTNTLRTVVNVSRQHQLSPKARKLYTIAAGLRRTARRLDFECAHAKRRLKEALRYSESEEYIASKVNHTTLNFIHSQLRLQSKQSRGRRFSTEAKFFALSLMKQSPKAYRLLKRTFALPSRSTLMALLSKVPIYCGINKPVMSCLKDAVHKMDSMDRYCCLMFDEMALEASLSYNIKEDYIDGFENCGEIRNKKFADHAMIWRGISKIATICDQHSTNTAAINYLKEQTSRVYGLVGEENKNLGFVIDGQEIIPLYDAPHLLKGIRNRLMEAKAKFVWKQSEQTASWEDIVKVYEADVGDFDTTMLNKLTDQHIYKQHMKPMKGKLAAQIFSQRVSSIMRGLVRLVPGFPSSASDTADFLLFFDKVFDSINGSTIKPQNGKLLRCAVTSSSDHIEFWNEAVRVLSTIKFLKEVTNADGLKMITSVPPSIKIGSVHWKVLKRYGENCLI